MLRCRRSGRAHPERQQSNQNRRPDPDAHTFGHMPKVHLPDSRAKVTPVTFVAAVPNHGPGLKVHYSGHATMTIRMPAVRKLGALVLLLAALSLPAAAKDVAVIVNRANPAKNLALSELAKICKVETRKWRTGRDITLVIREPESPEMALALKKVFGMEPEAVRALATASNAGAHEQPVIVIVDSDEVLVKAVATIPGAIGLVDVYSITGSINVLKIDGKSPLQPGYVLHGN
jgi:PBP superfamily domain